MPCNYDDTQKLENHSHYSPMEAAAEPLIKSLLKFLSIMLLFLPVRVILTETNY